jgi:hypothetical protein
MENIYLSIALTLLAAVSGMYLLAKTKAENLGRFFSFISWCVVLIAGLILICQLTRGILSMACRTGICPPSENCMPEMMIDKHVCMHGMKENCMMHSRCGTEECCSGKGCEGMNKAQGKCCDEMEEGEDGCHHGMNKECKTEEKKDSLRKK